MILKDDALQKLLEILEKYAPEVNAVAGTQHAPDITGRPRLDFTSGNINVNTVGLIGRGLARTVLPSAALGAASLVLGAGDVQAREERAKQDPSFINKLQVSLAQTERAADHCWFSTRSTDLCI